MGKWASKHRRNSSRKSRNYSVSNNDGRYSNSTSPLSKNSGPKLAPFQNPESVTCVDTYNGNLCLSGSTDGTVLLQDVIGNKNLNQILGHLKEVTKVKCGPNIYISASRDKVVKVWENEAEIGQLVGHSLSVSALEHNADFTQVWSGSRDNMVKLWDMETMSCVEESKISRNLVTDLSYSADLNIIAQTSEDRILKLWDPRFLEVVHSFPIQNQIQTSCDISHNICATTNNGFSGQGCEVCMWDLRQRKMLQVLKGHSETATCCRFVGSHLLSCSHDGTIKLWKSEGGIYHNASTLHLNSGTLNSLSLLSNELIVCGSYDKGILFANIKSDQLSM